MRLFLDELCQFPHEGFVEIYPQPETLRDWSSTTSGSLTAL